VEVIQLRDYGPRVRAGVHGQQIHDQIAKALKASSRVRLDFADVESVGATFLDSSLGALVARHGATVLRSIVFAHCSTRVEASIVKALGQAALLPGLLNFSRRRDAS
jgi:hypothetical protein